MKRILLSLLAGATLLSCDTTTPEPRTLEKLHGDWYGVEITNHLIAQGLWDTLHPHSITDLIGTFDTLIGTFVVDSLGETLDSADLVIDSDSVITVNGAVNAIDWSFDRQLINDFGQPVLQQLEANWNGNQKFKILRITEDELWLYFDDVIPVTIAGFTADMELRHTQYWQR